MGWDLLAGKTAERRKLMQLLWTSKSQVLRLEESSLYGQSDEVFYSFLKSKTSISPFYISNRGLYDNAFDFAGFLCRTSL